MGNDLPRKGDCLEMPLSIEAIWDILPHRYPFLMVDKVLELTPGKRVLALKNVTINEPFFEGHFPGRAVMPGVLILECMAQVAGIIMLSLPEHKGKLAFLGGLNKCRLLKPVVPGDTLIVEAVVAQVRGSIGKAHMNVTVEGEVVARSEMVFKLMDRTSPAEGNAISGGEDS